MLFSKKFRWGHNSGLAAVFNGSNRRESRDDGLAGSYVSLYQPKHRGFLTQIFQGFSDDPCLSLGQLKSQVVTEALPKPDFCGSDVACCFCRFKARRFITT